MSRCVVNLATTSFVVLLSIALCFPARHALGQPPDWRTVDAYPHRLPSPAAEAPIWDAYPRVSFLDKQPPVPPLPSGPASAPRNGSGKLQDAESLGTEPEDTSADFLRRQTPLLDPGQWQLDIGVTYAVAETDTPVGVAGMGGNLVGVLPGRIKQRLLLVPLEARYGWSERVQLFVNAPFGWANSEESFSGFDDFSNSGGIGDVRGGATVLLRRGDADYCPDVIGTFAFTAPTGHASLLTSSLAPNSQLGEGHWAVSANLLFLQTYDPVIVFYGLGARHQFDATLDGVDVNPGEQFFYQFGVGFAVNETVTLSTSFVGAYIADGRFNSQRLAGSSLEPMVLRMSATISRECVITEPFVEFGTTDDAVSSRIGITWSY